MKDPTALDYAEYLMSRGFAVVPVPANTKGAVLKGWPELRLTKDELPQFFGNGHSNIGVLLGEPSQWQVDVDLDHPLAVRLAPGIMPPTGMAWGRPGKRRSHLIYAVRGPVQSRKWTYAKNKSIVELRSTRAQTLAPGSIHPSGEPVWWDEYRNPAEIDPDELMLCLTRLESACRVQGGLEPSIVTLKKPAEAFVATPEVPKDPADPKDPVDPIDPVTVRALVEKCVVRGPGEHDACTLNLARALKIDCAIPNIGDAMAYFAEWWAKSKVHCENQYFEEARWKFERA